MVGMLVLELGATTPHKFHVAGTAGTANIRFNSLGGTSISGLALGGVNGLVHVIQTEISVNLMQIVVRQDYLCKTVIVLELLQFLEQTMHKALSFETANALHV
jgi:hypothetical protein